MPHVLSCGFFVIGIGEIILRNIPLDTHFEKVFADWDTVIYRAAKGCEHTTIQAKNKITGDVTEHRNRTAFWGHHSKKGSSGYLFKLNETQELKKQPPFTPEDFVIKDLIELAEDREDAVETAISQIDFSVGRLKKYLNIDDYVLCIGGDNNFRYDLAKRAPYKGGRTKKPLMFEEVREEFIYKYKRKILIAENREADDLISEIAYDNYVTFLKTKKWKHVISYLDKDLQMCISPRFDYTKPDNGIVVNTPFDAAKCYAVQLLTGDRSVDNIMGLDGFTDEIREKYKIPNRAGIGKATANDFLEGCQSIKELFERVIEAYKSYYGTSPHEFTTWTGEKEMWTWRDYISDTAKLLWMHRTEDCKYDIFKDTFDKLKIEY